MKPRNVIVAAVLILLALFAYAVMSLEEPAYTVVETAETFELRRYQPYIVAETVVEGDFEAAGGQAFRILVDYIQRGNQGRRNLPMTAPVNQQPVAPETFTQGAVTRQGTAPGGGSDGPWLFQFVMPKEYSLPMLPAPIDERVRLREVPAGLVAAHRYSGGWGEDRYRERERALLDALEQAGLTPTAAPVFARYNAPFVPWFLRRNEVLVPVARD